MRSWLNKEFLSDAFNGEEQGTIITTTVDNSISQGHHGWGTKGGNNTRDKIFLLSNDEAKRYFLIEGNIYYNGVRTCRATAYAKAHGAIEKYTDLTNTSNCEWLLRSPGSLQHLGTYVAYDGYCPKNQSADERGYAVRPALWVNLNSDYFE